MAKKQKELESQVSPTPLGIDMIALAERVKNYRAGNIRKFLHNWKKFTSDAHILDIVKNGLQLAFCNEYLPEKGPFEYKRQVKEKIIIDDEIQKLLSKQVIERTIMGEEGDYFSNLFTAPKKDGTYRTILNLKFLNKECQKEHFKMETLQQAIHMVKPGAYLASIDIKDAFYSVPIYEGHKKYLKFMWQGNAFQFRAMPNGYVDAMRVFTKLLKPAFSTLRDLGHESVIYVDDSLLQGDTAKECLDNVVATLDVLQQLGFILHHSKSTFTPTQRIEFLGFIIDTVSMTITLTPRKKEKIKDLGYGLLHSIVTIRMVSRFIGNLTAAFDGVPMGRLHYRHLEMSKTISLKMNGYNFDAPCYLSTKAIEEIRWWLDNITSSFAYIKAVPKVDYTIYTDASLKDGGGWGAYDEIHDKINGRWSLEEQWMNINCLELKAITLAIEAYAPLRPQCKHIRIMSDNTSAIAYINKQGGTHCMVMNDLAVDIWSKAAERGIHISAAHIPGIHNVLADSASREFHDAAEWMMAPHIFSKITEAFGNPDIDLFASRLNKQLPVYASRKPDPESTYIDAMMLSWTDMFIYAFPPFSMMWPVIAKLEVDKVEQAIMIIPRWPTQSWYPRIMKKVVGDPIMISSRHLVLPGTTKTHPLQKMTLLAVKCSW